MSHANRIGALLACFSIAVTAAAESPCCMATPTDLDADGRLDDSTHSPLASGYTPFPRYFPSHEWFATTQPPQPASIALCSPDLYCSLASN
jgi:hypothetical protein